jgi:hypothetical protein
MRARRGLGLLVCAAVTVVVTARPVAAAAGLEGVPHYDHIAVIVLENESFTSTWGPGSPATYLNSLRAQGAFADEYFATGHVSLDDYIAMVSGQPDQPLTGSDCQTVSLWTCAQAQTGMAGGRNLADQLEDAHLAWAGYEDSMPSPCFHGPYSPSSPQPDPYQGDSTAPPAGDYADRHDPFLYFPDIVGDDARCAAHVLPYAQLGTGITAGTLPAFSLITPDTCHDGHDVPCAGGAPGGLVSADAWLQRAVPPLLGYLQSHNGLLLITFDEGANTDTSGCCTGGPGGGPGFGGRIGLLALGSGVSPGLVDHTSYDHASLLRTVEDSLGISEHLNNAGAAVPMRALLGAPGVDVPEAPLTALLLAAAVLSLAARRRSRRS